MAYFIDEGKTKLFPFVFTSGAIAVSVILNVPPSGITTDHFTVSLPNFTTAVSAVLTVIDGNGKEIYTSSTLPKNDEYTITKTVVLADTTTLTLTLNAAAGGAHTAYVGIGSRRRR